MENRKNNIFRYKVLQIVFALIETILYIKMNLERGDIPLSKSTYNYSTIEQILIYILIIPGMLWIVLLWNRWFYNDIFSDKFKNVFSYENFQMAGAILMFAVMVIMALPIGPA